MATTVALFSTDNIDLSLWDPLFPYSYSYWCAQNILSCSNLNGHPWEGKVDQISASVRTRCYDILENKKTLLFIRAKQLLNSIDSENLTKLYSSKFTDDLNKISEVRRLFEKCNIPEKISSEIENFTNISLKILDELQISHEKKDFLRDFANSLMKRNI